MQHVLMTSTRHVRASAKCWKADWVASGRSTHHSDVCVYVYVCVCMAVCVLCPQEALDRGAEMELTNGLGHTPV